MVSVADSTGPPSSGFSAFAPTVCDANSVWYAASGATKSGSVYKGGGSVQMKKCASNGKSYSTVGSGTATTFNKGRVTGLTNCANSVSDLVEANAKTHC